jgi:hypothetical protein
VVDGHSEAGGGKRLHVAHELFGGTLTCGHDMYFGWLIVADDARALHRGYALQFFLESLQLRASHPEPYLKTLPVSGYAGTKRTAWVRLARPTEAVNP